MQEQPSAAASGWRPGIRQCDVCGAVSCRRDGCGHGRAHQGAGQNDNAVDVTSIRLYSLACARLGHVFMRHCLATEHHGVSDRHEGRREYESGDGSQSRTRVLSDAKCVYIDGRPMSSYAGVNSSAHFPATSRKSKSRQPTWIRKMRNQLEALWPYHQAWEFAHLPAQAESVQNRLDRLVDSRA